MGPLGSKQKGGLGKKHSGQRKWKCWTVGISEELGLRGWRGRRRELMGEGTRTRILVTHQSAETLSSEQRNRPLQSSGWGVKPVWLEW